MPSLVEIGLVVFEKKIFKLRQYIFVVISPWKRAGPLFEQIKPLLRQNKYQYLFTILPIIFALEEGMN